MDALCLPGSFRFERSNLSLMTGCNNHSIHGLKEDINIRPRQNFVIS